MKFESENSFKEALSYLFENQDDEYALDNSIPGFTSYLRALEILADDGYGNFENYPNLVHLVEGTDIDKELTAVVEFELLKSVLNQDGIVQIAGDIYKYTDKYVYVTKNVNDVESLINSRYTDIENLQIRPILKKEIGVDSRWAYFGSCSKNFFWTTNKKVIGNAFALFDAGGFSEISLKTRAMKHSWWGWHTFRHRELVINGSGHYNQFGDPFANGDVAYSFNAHKHKAHSIKRTIQWNWNVPNPFYFVDNNTYHDCFGDAGCDVIIN